MSNTALAIAKMFYEDNPITDQNVDCDGRPVSAPFTITWEQLPEYDTGIFDSLSAEGGRAVEILRVSLAASLRSRADWLRSEYLKGGVREHLQPRETECRAIADMLERGRLPE